MATASGPGGVLQASEGKTRFIRLQRLLVGGTDVMRELFDFIVPPANLTAKLSDPAVHRRLTDMRRNRILTPRQWQKLYPPPGSAPVQSTSFDINLLFTLLREHVIPGLSPPSTGWNKLPNAGDISLPADMVRIKYYRNDIAHCGKMELSKQEFTHYWKEIKDALLRIVGHYAASGSSTVKDWESAIDSLLTAPLTEDDENNLDELTSWYLNEKDLKEIVVQNQEYLMKMIKDIAEAKNMMKSLHQSSLGSSAQVQKKKESKEVIVQCEVKITGVGACDISRRYYTDQLKDVFEKVLITEELQRNLEQGERIELSFELLNDEAKLASVSPPLLTQKKKDSSAQEPTDKEARMNECLKLMNEHLMRDRYDDAILPCERYLAIAQESRDKYAEMNAYKMLGELHLKKQNCDDAIWYGEKCLAIAHESGDKVAEVNVYMVLGEAHLKREEYDDAISCFMQYLDIAQESGDKVAEMNAYQKLAEAHLKKEEIDDAYSVTREGMKIAKDLQDDKAISVFESNQSWIYEEVGVKTSDELLYFLNVDGIHEDVSGQEIRNNFVWYASYIWYVIHRRRSEYDAALSCLMEAEAFLEARQGKKRKQWLCKQGISEMYVQLKQHDEALKYQREALDIAVTKSQQAKSHFSLGNLYYQRQELENAKQSLEESLKCYELIFKDLKQNDRFKIAFVDKYKEAYKMLLKVLIETNKKEEALVLSDRYRARALKDILASSYGLMEDPTDEENLQYADVQTLVSSNEYTLLFYATCDKKLCTFIMQADKLEWSIQDFKHCDSHLYKMVNKTFHDMKERQVLMVNCEDGSLDDIDNSEEMQNPKEDELTLPLTRWKEERSAEQCHSICEYRGSLSKNTAESRRKTSQPLKELHQELIGSIKGSIKQGEIVIIPEGPLYKVPFAALQDPDSGQYLSETKRIRMAPSIATLKLLQEAYPTNDYPSGKKALIIGDPLIGRVKLGKDETQFQRLDDAKQEATKIAKLFGVNPLLEGAATKPEIMKRLHEGTSVVHIAAHGILSKSSIVLAPDPEIRKEKIPDEEDYMLTMADVQQTQVRAQLVVLSCCYSGRGQIKSEGVVGMCRAFLASGARAVVGSLWSVKDKATRKFMETFYKYLKDGKSASTSLHLTMNDMRRTPEYSEPKYWAPFFLMGDDVTIKF